MVSAELVMPQRVSPDEAEVIFGTMALLMACGLLAWAIALWLQL